jgi:hypothetical protein
LTEGKNLICIKGRNIRGKEEAMKRNLVAVIILGAVLLAPVILAQEGTVPKAAEDTAKAVEKKAVEAMPAEVQAKPQVKAEPASGIHVEAQLCSGVEERMPTGMASSFPSTVDKVYLWCKVTGCPDTCTISHVWYHKGEEMASVELPVRSSSWRTWSSKSILPEWAGEWTVKVMDAGGGELKSLSFTITPAE